MAPSTQQHRAVPAAALRRLAATHSALSGSTVGTVVSLTTSAATGAREPVICAVARTPVGRYRGALRGYTAVELGALAAAEALRRAGVVLPLDSSASGLDGEGGGVHIIDEVLFGQVLQAGAGQAPARQVALACGLPDSTPCTTINKVCGSSLKCVMLAATSIRAGEHQALLCGGMESMTRAPGLVAAGADTGERPGSSMLMDGLTDPFSGAAMGETGEYVSQDHGISRELADEWSARSHARAHAAWESGALDWESFPVPGLDRGGGAVTLSRDEGIRPAVDAAALAQLAPAFWTKPEQGGRVTAGNSSQLSDGGAAVLVASRARAESNGWPVLARIVDHASAALPPRQVMAAPIPAVRKLLRRNGLRMGQLACFEHNEAFAAASCAVARALGADPATTNSLGGAVAIGHPLGASGARCLATTINRLRREPEGALAVTTLCLGGGEAVAMLIAAGPDLPSNGASPAMLS